MRYIVFAFILCLPLLIYGASAWFVKSKEAQTAGAWDGAPFMRLVVIGLFLLAAALVASRFVNSGEKPTRIVPPQYDDDRFLRKPDQGPEQDNVAPAGETPPAESR